MKEITFIHSADLHLDSPFSGLKNLPQHILKTIKESTFTAFQTMINEAILRSVDFILLAGDIYDGENRNLSTQVRFRNEMIKLQKHNIQVYIIHGNHDHLGGKWISIKMPSNVHIFSSEYEVKTYKKEDVTVNIYGYSYPVQHVKQRIIEQYTKIDGASYHIAMLHGNLEGQSEHSNYAPFTVHELIEKDMDYWALGHIHKRQEILTSPPVIYPGNIQGRHKKESGLKGFYYVQLKDKHSDLEFVPTSEIVWEDINITLERDDDFDSLLQKCRKEIQQIRNENYKIFLFLTIEHCHASISFEDYHEDLLELLKDEEESEEYFVYPYAVYVNSPNGLENTNLPIIQMLKQHEWTERDIQEASWPLYKHTIGRKFLETLTDDDKVELIKEAEQLLSTHLSRGSGE